MSYDLCLRDPNTGEAVKLQARHQWRGGTYAVGGCDTASFNVTYNYAHILQRVLGEKGICELYGKTGAMTFDLLSKAIAELTAAVELNGDGVSNDYWEATSGNVKHALMVLLDLAVMCPEGVWNGD